MRSGFLKYTTAIFAAVLLLVATVSVGCSVSARSGAGKETTSLSDVNNGTEENTGTNEVKERNSVNEFIESDHFAGGLLVNRAPRYFTAFSGGFYDAVPTGVLTPPPERVAVV